MHLQDRYQTPHIITASWLAFFLPVWALSGLLAGRSVGRSGPRSVGGRRGMVRGGCLAAYKKRLKLDEGENDLQRDKVPRTMLTWSNLSKAQSCVHFSHTKSAQFEQNALGETFPESFRPKDEILLLSGHVLCIYIECCS